MPVIPSCPCRAMQGESEKEMLKKKIARLYTLLKRAEREKDTESVAVLQWIIFEIKRNKEEKENVMDEEKKYLLVGSYVPADGNGQAEKIMREFHGQGMIFKSDEAFYDIEHPDRVCYIPELTDSKYTRSSFLALCNNQTDRAEELYEAVDWQHPESLMEEWLQSGELVICSNCRSMLNYSGETECKYCGAVLEPSVDGT